MLCDAHCGVLIPQIWPNSRSNRSCPVVRDSFSDDRNAQLETADEAPPGSDRFPRRPLSALFWGLDWNRHLPVTLTADGIDAHVSSYDRSLPFVREHYRAIFHEQGDGPFSTSHLDDQKARYYRLAGDFFEIKQRDRTVGLVVGTPIDWSTYYVRSAAVVPEFQSRQLGSRLLRTMFPHLAAAGVERVEADTSPSNLCVIQLLTRLKFNITGSVLSDRWGAQVRLTKFLDSRGEDVFLQQFCMGVVYQLRDRVQRAAPNRGPERRQS